MQNRPASTDSKVILQWLNDNAKNPHAVNAYLSELRSNDFAKTLNLNNPNDVILHALTTNDVRKLDANKLRRAITNTMPPGDVIILVELIIKAIIMLIEYLQSSGLCKKPDKAAKALFLNTLKNLPGNNPFINLAGAHLHDLDLPGIKLQFANLDGVDFRRTNLNGADLSCANMAHADCEKADLTHADCDETNLKWANLKNAKMQAYDAGDYSLKSYLQTNWPANSKYSSEVSQEEMHHALSEIDKELNEEKKLHPHSFLEKLQRHMYHMTVARNVNNVLVDQKKNLNNSHAVMLDSFGADFFKNHGTAHFAAKLNSFAIKAHNRFHRGHHRTDPLLGNTSQNVLIKGLDTINEWLNPKKKLTPASK